MATGHLYADEADALVRAALEHKVRNLLIQHADMAIAPVPLDLQMELARRGAFLEKYYLACGDDFRSLTVAEMADTIRRIGGEHCALVTDHGQPRNPTAVEALSRFVEQLLEADITERQIERMLKDNPRQLLGI